MKIIITEAQFKKISNFINENDNDNEKLNVLFVGDSHSAGEGWTWNYQLSKTHPSWNVTNIVKVGVKTDWMLSNLKTELQKKHYDLVFILGGTNDMMSSNSIDNVISNIQKMVDLTNQQDGKAIVVSGFDSETVMDPEKLKPTSFCDKKCQERFLNRNIEFQRTLKSSISNATVVPPLKGDHSWTTDGIHAGTSKHAQLKDWVNQYVDSSKNVDSEKPVDNRKELFQKFLKAYMKLVNDGKEINKNSTNREIKIMQIVLAITGEKVELNGILDEDTQSKLKTFQSKNGLAKTGYFDLLTIGKLTEKLIPGYRSVKSDSSLDSQKFSGKNVSSQKLLNDIMSRGVNENAAKGLVANAFGESKLNVQAKGDSGSYAQKSNKSIPIGGKRYCSFGLWQYNVCGGAGIAFLNKFGSDASSSNIEDKLNVLFDYDKQIDYIVEKIKPEQRKGDKDVLTWVDWIVDNIERPSDRTGAKRTRRQFAIDQGWD